MMCQNKKKNPEKKWLTGAAVWLSTLAVCAALVLAQDNVVAPAEVVAAEPSAVVVEAAPVAVETPQAVVEAAPVQEAAPAEELSAVPVLSGQSIQTISFKKDMPIKDALRMMAQMYQKNIVPSAKVDGIVTVSYLYDVSFEEALQAILGTHKYEMKGNFIKVYTNEEFMADKSRFEHAIIPLYYINAAEAQKLATPLLSEFGQIGVTSPALLDTEPGRGGDSLAIGDRLVVSDYPENIAKIHEVLADVDVAPLQVLIEVTVLEAKLTETTKFGIDFDTLNSTVTTIGDEGVSQVGLATQGGSGLNVGILNNNLRVFISALETVTDTTLLANPKILALNKQAGKLIIGKQDGYYSARSSSTEGDVTTNQQIEFLESGTVLQFRPFIGKDGLIRLELRPEQSDGSVDGQGLPNKTTTEVMTNIMVRDGKTIVIGGLFQEKTILGKSQVPLLGDLPILGELFSSKNDQSIRTELIVLITPHIINDPEQADGADRMNDAQRLAYQARKNITWMSRARMDEGRYASAVKYYREGDNDAALAELNSPFNIQRNYLEEARLRDRILSEQLGQSDGLERVMLRNLEKEESSKWLRK